MTKLLTALIVGVVAFLGVLSLGFVLALIQGLVVWLLWEPVAVAVFSAPAISYWQAVGLALLAGVLFGKGK